MKKIIAVILFAFVLSINVSAAFNVGDINTPDGFFVYSENPKKVADIVSMTPEKLKQHNEENNIIYFAVNEDNTKSIQLSCQETDFSNSISDLSLLSDTTVKSLIPDITGLNNIQGEIIFHKDLKFVKINIREKNEGYILTQFFTVTDKKMYILSFITENNGSLDYIDQAFSPVSNTDESDSTFRIIVIVATIIFGGVCLVLIFTIVKDLVLRKKETAEETTEETDIIEADPSENEISESEE